MALGHPGKRGIASAFKRFSVIFPALLVLFTSLGSASEAQTDPAIETIHEQLRALRDQLVEASNTMDLEAAAETFTPDIIVTTMTNDVLRGPNEVKAFIAEMFGGDSQLIDSMSAEVVVDELSRLYADNQVAVATGDALTHFVLSNGREYDWPIRWTAVVINQDGDWRISHIQMAGNAIDNPVLGFAVWFWRWIAVAAGAGGLIVGYVLSRLMRRRRAA